MRKTYEEIKELCKKLNVDRLYSWSRVNCYLNSSYEYFLSYVKHEKPDKESSIYGCAGGYAHQILEDLYSDKIKYEDMLNEFEDAWTTMDIADLKFNRSDESKNDNIKNKYYENLKHFFKSHNMLTCKVDLERFITIKVGKYYLQGYIDLTRRDEEGNFVIQDWKTSTIYKNDKAVKEAGQLILYAEGLRQLGISLEKIKICWNFLKYTSVTTQLANGKENIREIERCKIGESLASNCKMWLKKLGYENEIDSYLELLKDTNDISCLPKDVQEKYKFDDCYVFVDLTEELINDLKNKIENTIDTIIEKELQYKKTSDERLFWDSPESIEKQSYYFANLCSYSPYLHKPYGEYLKKLKEKEDNKNNVFSGIGESFKDDIKNDLELDWLNSL